MFLFFWITRFCKSPIPATYLMTPPICSFILFGLVFFIWGLRYRSNEQCSKVYVGGKEIISHFFRIVKRRVFTHSWLLRWVIMLCGLERNSPLIILNNHLHFTKWVINSFCLYMIKRVLFFFLRRVSVNNGHSFSILLYFKSVNSKEGKHYGNWEFLEIYILSAHYSGSRHYSC